jgi:hypothetical protein
VIENPLEKLVDATGRGMGRVEAEASAKEVQ